jgi:hypothetical protein
MRSIVLVFAAAVLAAPPLKGQQQDTTVTPERPFVAGGVYDKPYLTRLLGRTALGGYAEAHARLERADGATEDFGFEAKRWNIFTTTQVSDFVRIAAEVEFEDGAEEIKLEFAAIDVSISRQLTLRAGMLLSPLGKFNLAHDSPRNEFTDRPLVATELLGVALSEPGLGVLGLFPLGGQGRITYELYATNGFDDGLITDSPDGTRIPQGRGNFEDNNNSPAVVGRLAWSPRLGFEFGVSAHHGAYNVFESEGTQVDQKRTLTIWVFDAEVEAVGFRVLGEASTTSIDIPPGLRGIFASMQRGFYLEAVRDFGHGWVRTMPRSFFSAGGRIDVVDFDGDVDGDTIHRYTAGFNFRPTRDTVLKLNYFRGTMRDGFNNPIQEAGFLFSVATYF